MDSYLIPANAKKSLLYFGLFQLSDIVILLAGWVITFSLVLAIQPDSIGLVILELLPGAIATFLIFPIPNYHNCLTVLIAMFKFYTNQQNYKWKGWCFGNEQDSK